MEKINKFDRKTSKKITDEVRKELASLLEKRGLKIIKTSGTFEDETLNMKIVFNTLSGQTPDERNFITFCNLYGFEPEDLGRHFVSNGTEYRISGLCPNRTKYPLKAERVSDKVTYKFSDKGMKQKLDAFSKASG